MFYCPKCRSPLTTVKGASGVYWHCPGCDGRSATLALLRKSIPANVVNSLWQSARTGSPARKRLCPSCGRLMAEVPTTIASAQPLLDVCTLCHVVWFDYSEYKALPKLPPTPPRWDASLPQAAREKLARIEVEAIRENARRQDADAGAPDAWWQWIPGVLGMPIEQECEGLGTHPWVTWGVATGILAVSLLAFADLPGAIQTFGLLPAQVERYGGLTLLTSFFVHGGLFHLLGNLYFLLIFGDNVEECLGRWKYGLLLLVATLAGNLLHILGNPSSGLPCVGASGGISGVIAFYALQFPKAKLALLFRLYFWFRWIRLPAYVLFIGWLLMQFWGAWTQLSGFSNVSALAHLGGVAAGLVFWLATRGPSLPGKAHGTALEA